MVLYGVAIYLTSTVTFEICHHKNVLCRKSARLSKQVNIAFHKWNNNHPSTSVKYVNVLVL